MLLPLEGYRSNIWPELKFQQNENHIVIVSETMLETIGSALVGGGLGEANHIVNMQVSKDFDDDKPEEVLVEKIRTFGYPAPGTVGLMTAALLQSASIQEETVDCFGVVVCTTAGIGNAARAGLPRPTFSSYRPGTINICIFVQGKLTPSAKIEAIVTATEAKAAALQDLSIIDIRTNFIATGTSSDAIVLATCKDSFNDTVHYHAGTATTLGNAVGRLVYDAVKESVQFKERNE